MMKKFLMILMFALICVSLASVANALTLEADYILNNKGAVTGQFQKTQMPTLAGITMNGWETKQLSAEVGTAQCIMQYVAGSTEASSYIYIIALQTDGSAIYRTIDIGGTSDKVVIQ